MPRGKHTRDAKAAEPSEEDAAAEAELPAEGGIRCRNTTLAPRMPFRGLIVGASGSGKTVFVARMLLEHYPTTPVIWIAPKLSLMQGKALDALRAHFEHGPGWTELDGSNGWDESLRTKLDGILASKPKNEPAILVLDDLMCAPGRSSYVANMYTCCRHRMVSILELQQRVFVGDRFQRTQRLNSTFFACFAFPAKAEIGRLVQQLESKERAKAITEAYSEILDRDPHGCIIIDTTEPESSPMRYRDTTLDNGLLF